MDCLKAVTGFIYFKEHEDGKYSKEKVVDERYDAGESYETDSGIYPAYDIWIFVSAVL
ncbi:hypothetical protein GCM10008910_33240 [Faecalicatena orotica]